MSADDSAARIDGSASALNSQELLDRVRGGDVEAAERLFSRYLPQLRRWAHRRVPQWARSVADTGDVVQDAILNTFKRLPLFEAQRDGALLGYLRRSLINGIRDQCRQASRRPQPVPLEEEDFTDAAESPLDLTITRETRQRYLMALKRLRPDDRTAIVARLELGYTYEQLALVLRKPTAEAARLAVRRALLRLAVEMDRA